jgi:hypothetical protein
LAFDYLEPIKLAHKHIKESSLADYYDEVLMPALRMAENDRHDELLNDDQATFVAEAAEDLIQELGDEAFAAIAAKAHDPHAAIAITSVSSENATAGTRVLCIPLRDQADETVSHMLAQLLVAEGFDVATESGKSTTGELVERVAEAKPELVVISVLPPIGSRGSRLLSRRLRSRFPDLPIVIGFWTGAEVKEDLLLPANDPATKVATSLSEAVSLVRSMAAQRKLAAKTA